MPAHRPLLLAVAVVALAPAAAGARSKPPPPPPVPVYEADGSITSTSVVTTRCPALGGIGTITERTTTEQVYTVTGTGQGKHGQLQSTSRVRVKLEQEVVGTDSVAPRNDQGRWDKGASRSTQFSKSVFVQRGKLIVDLKVATGLRARRETVKPWPGESAPVKFDGPSRVEDDSDRAGRCMSKTIETRLTGTIDVKLRR